MQCFDTFSPSAYVTFFRNLHVNAEILGLKNTSGIKYVFVCPQLYEKVFSTQQELCEILQGGSNMSGTDLCVNKPHCAAAVRP